MTKLKNGIKKTLLVVSSLSIAFVVGWISGAICDQYYERYYKRATTSKVD